MNIPNPFEGINETTCIKCGGKLTRDDMGLHRKLINRGAREFMCINCLADKYHVSVERMEEKIRQFKEQGCTLFTI